MEISIREQGKQKMKNIDEKNLMAEEEIKQLQSKRKKFITQQKQEERKKRKKKKKKEKKRKKRKKKKKKEKKEKKRKKRTAT